MTFRRTALGLALCLAAFAFTGCDKAKDPTAALTGTWTLDMQTFKESADYKAMSEAQRKMAEGLFSAMKAEFTFTKDKVSISMEMMGQKKDETASYVVTKTEGKKLTLESTDKDGKKEAVEVEVDGDRLTFGKGTKEKFYLKRKK